MNLAPIKDILEIFSYLVVIGGIPIALAQYIRSARAERREREKAVYDALDQRYMDYLTLCLDNPDLDIFDAPLPLADRDSEEGMRRRKESISYLILLSIFERAYLMYRDAPSDFKTRQWRGWEAYIRRYLKRDRFRKTLQSNGLDEFDRDFVSYIKQQAGL